MKKVLAIVAALMFATPVMADDGLLAQLGLSGLQVVSVDEASQVSGRGFITTHGFVEGEIDFDDLESFFFADIDAFQEIDIEGLNNATGVLGAAGQLTVDFSSDDDGVYWVYGGVVTVVSGTTISAKVDE